MYATGLVPASEMPGAALGEAILPHLLANGYVLESQPDLGAYYTGWNLQAPAGHYILMSAQVTNTSTYLSFSAYEEYTPGAPSPAMGVMEHSTSSSVQTYSINAQGQESAALPFGTLRSRSRSIQGSSAGTPYWISITPERLIIGSRNGSNDHAVYIGSLTSIPSEAQVAKSLVSTNLSGSVSPSPGHSREPGISTAQSLRGALQGSLGFDADITQYPDAFSGRYPASRVRYGSRRDNGGRMGFLRDVYAVKQVGLVNGDTAIIDGRLHVVISEGTSNPTLVDTTV